MPFAGGCALVSPSCMRAPSRDLHALPGQRVPAAMIARMISGMLRGRSAGHCARLTGTHPGDDRMELGGRVPPPRTLTASRLGAPQGNRWMLDQPARAVTGSVADENVPPRGSVRGPPRRLLQVDSGLRLRRHREGLLNVMRATDRDRYPMDFVVFRMSSQGPRMRCGRSADA